MEGLRTLSPDAPLARALERGRERFNARVAMRRRGGGRFEPAALAGHLVESVAPAVAAVAACAPSRVDAVVEALFDLSLELLGSSVVGPASRHPRVVEAWRELLPRLGPQLAADPARVAASITNAAYNLGLEPSARAAEWLREMASLAPAVPDADLLLEAGKVLAWRAGMAHWRESALEAWERLPEPLARRALGLPEGAPASREALRAGLEDPWTRPGAAPGPDRLAVVATVGGFRGYGGPFLAPPRVFSSGGRLFAADGEQVWSLHADCFGQTVQRVRGAPVPEARPGLARLELDGTLRFRGMSARLEAIAGASGFAAVDGVVAVTRLRSHRIALVARVGAPA